MDGADLDGLTRLMRAEFTAVNLQFTHILSLRVWDEGPVRERITATDDGDFPNGMAILDELVRGGHAVVLAEQELWPGADVPGVLAAEAATEAAMAALLSDPDPGPRSAIHAARARAARAGYPEWLRAARDPADTGTIAAETPRSRLVALLTMLLEQAMGHAFIHWHADNRDRADASWRLSGAGMMMGAALVRREALEGALSAPGAVPASWLSYDGEEARERDRSLLRECAEAANAASEAGAGGALQRLCADIAHECALLADWDWAEPFPARLGSSPRFASFQATRDMFL